jgi:MFS family permease
MFPQLGAPIALALSSATFLVTGLTLGNTDQSFLDYGWRVPFLISIVLLGAGLYVRLQIAETPVFRRAQGQQQLATRAPLREALTYAPRQILLSAGTLTTMFALFYIGTTYLTSYGTSPKGAGLSRAFVLSIGIGAGIAMAAGVIASSVAADRLGRRAVVVLCCAGAVVWSLLLFPLLSIHSPTAFGISVIVTLALMGLAYGPVGALLPETFPTHFRYTGAGTSYNMAGIAGGAIPPLIAAPLAAAFGSFSIGIMLCAISLVSRKLVDFCFNPPNFGKDCVGIGSPGKRCTVGVPVGDIVPDRGDELFDRAECASAYRLASDQAEPDLDLVDPRRPDRCAMKSDVRIVGQPVAHLGREVRAQVVHHNVNLAVNVRGGDRLHECQKLLGSTPRVAFSGDFTRRNIQRSEQIDGAMPDVVVCPLFGLAERHGEQRLSTVQCLHSGLLVHAQHDRSRRRRQVQAHDVSDLLSEVWIPRQFERVLPMRL